MGYSDLTGGLHLAACGGSTVKIFDIGVVAGSGGGDPCVLSYSPGHGSVNAVRWNHTNLVIASAGDDKKISFWHKKGRCLAFLPDPGIDVGDNIEESIVSISFSNKGSRYLCSGGSGQIVRIWDLQRKKCIKWLAGHSDTITGVMYNCRDEYLASISMRGDLILHSLASGARTAEVNDPNRQVLRVLDYSRHSRHILTTAGDDGSVHLWDTTARSPKASWLKQHSAPTTGLCLSPSTDKIIASVGLDKKLYIFDSGMKKPSECVPCKEPFSSLAFNDEGTILAAGTSGGHIVFFDIRAKHQPFTSLRAYNSSEAVSGLSWQRSKPVPVNENCSDEIALLGGTTDDSVLMPDPLPASSLTSATSLSGIRTSLKTTSTSKTQALKDEMDVFSPLVDVQPITPSLSKWWEGDEGKRSFKTLDKRSINFLDSGLSRKYPLGEELNGSDVPIWANTPNQRQDETPSLTGTLIRNDLSFLRQPTPLSRFGPSASPSFASLQDPSVSFNSHGLSQITTTSLNPLRKGNLDNSQPGSARLSSYAERLSATSAFNEGSPVASPKMKKIGAETREELLNISRQEVARTVSSGSGASTQLATNGVTEQAEHTLNAPVLDQQLGTYSSFSLQLVQRTLEETLSAVQKSIHEDVRNLHIDLIRQFHMQEMNTTSLISELLEKQEILIKEVQLLRQENQQLRQLL